MKKSKDSNTTVTAQQNILIEQPHIGNLRCVNCMAIIRLSKTLLLGIGIELVGTFLHWWNPNILHDEKLLEEFLSR